MKILGKIKNVIGISLLIILAGYILTFTNCSLFDDPEPDITTPGNALTNYLNNEDTTYQWEVVTTYNILDVAAYDLLLTSQQWREYTWKHQLTILIPPDIQFDESLLWITGGSLKDGTPNWASTNDEETWTLGILAGSYNTIVAILRQTPNQPLYDNLKEDALISYTLNSYQNDGDYTWPLLFPMVKGAVRAMDAVQEFSQETIDQEISGFLISGASKRGWTTWLTGAVDSRVVAIAPAVIDVLNMPVNLDYQLEVWGDYSVEIQDYVDLGIPQTVNTDQGDDIATMIDPYSYRNKLTMPKLILIGTNDPYWPVDAIKHYLNDLQGENYIHYVANAGHDLNGGQQALRCVGAFMGHTFAQIPYRECEWDVTESGTGITLSVEGTTNIVKAAYLWMANSEDRDFRDEVWNSTQINTVNNSTADITITYPDTGFRAFYIDLEYTDIIGRNYTKSTRMFVADDDEIL
ncbi:PhoPQ-activated pathogenicity-related family protein [Bacteroidota bacterium]